MSELQDRVSGLLSTALGEAGEMVTKWCAVVETLDTDGARAVWVMSNDEAKPWDNLGMLQFAMQLEQAQAMRWQTGDDDG